MTDWISGAEAAEILGMTRMTVWRSLHNPKTRADRWGAEGVGWRRTPMSPFTSRQVYQVSRARAVELAGGDKPAAGEDVPGDPAG